MPFLNLPDENYLDDDRERGPEDDLEDEIVDLRRALEREGVTNAELRERVAGLEAHIKACATTADGVPIRPGMELWFFDGSEIRMVHAYPRYYSSRASLVRQFR